MGIGHHYTTRVPTPLRLMPDDNRISTQLSDANRTAILQKLGEIRALLPFLVSLTPEERQTLPKLGDRTLAFDEKCRTYTASNPRLVPGFVEAAEVEKDRALRAPLSEVARELDALAQALGDTVLLVGHEIYMADLAFYQNVRQAAKRGVPGAQAIFDDLKERFPGGGGTPAQPPPAPSP
jgi:glutathione S-transferase